MAAAVALLTRDRGGPALRFLFLGIPELDDRLDEAVAAFHGFATSDAAWVSAHSWTRI